MLVMHLHGVIALNRRAADFVLRKVLVRARLAPIMNSAQLNTEVQLLNAVISPALNGLVLGSHISNDHVITFVSYRQTTLELATYLKLSSLFKANSPIDSHVVDRIEDKFRFTVIYNLQSFQGNTRMQIVTKTNDLLPLISLQGVYPAFN